jgi:hypothetical protein
MAPPLRVADAARLVHHAARPRHHAEAGERIEEALDLGVIHRRQVAALVCRGHVREHVGDVLRAQQAGEALNVRRITEVGELIQLVLASKPVGGTEPSVLQPDGVAAAVMAAVGDVEAGCPHTVADDECPQRQRDDPDEHHNAGVHGAPSSPPPPHVL